MQCQIMILSALCNALDDEAPHQIIIEVAAERTNLTLEQYVGYLLRTLQKSIANL